MSPESEYVNQNLVQEEADLQLISQANLADRQEQSGQLQLAETIVLVAEQEGEAGVRDYLEDVLSDTEGKVDPAERQAATQLLAGEQRVALKEGLVSSGEDMVSKMIERNVAAEESLPDHAQVTQKVVGDLAESHRQQVGRHLERGVDTRRAGQEQAKLESQVKGSFKHLTEQGELVAVWSNGNKRTVNEFSDTLKKAVNHERALDEAEAITDPSYEGEPKDVSKVIDDAVKEETATKLHEAFTQAVAEGNDPKEAVLGIMLQKEGSSGLTEAKLRALKIFSANYKHFSDVEPKKIEQTTNEVKETLRRFAGKGRDGYSFVRSIDEARDLYRSQTRALDSATKAAASIAPMSRAVLTREKEKLGRLKQYLATAEKTPDQKPEELALAS